MVPHIHYAVNLHGRRVLTVIVSALMVLSIQGTLTL